MTSKRPRAGIDLVVNEKAAVGSLKKVKKEWDDLALGFNAGLELVQKAWGKVAGGVDRFNALITEAIDLYDTQAQAERRFIQAAELRGRVTEGLLEKTQAYNSAIQRQSGIGDEVLLGLQQQLLTMNVYEDELTVATSAVIGLSHAHGIGLTEATRLVGRVIGGNVNALREYGQSFRTADEAIQFYAKSSHLATERVNELRGAQEVLDASMGDLLETIGSIPGKSTEMVKAVGEMDRVVRLLDRTIQDAQPTLTKWLDESLRFIRENRKTTYGIAGSILAGPFGMMGLLGGVGLGAGLNSVEDGEFVGPPLAGMGPRDKIKDRPRPGKLRDIDKNLSEDALAVLLSSDDPRVVSGRTIQGRGLQTSSARVTGRRDLTAADRGMFGLPPISAADEYMKDLEKSFSDGLGAISKQFTDFGTLAASVLGSAVSSFSSIVADSFASMITGADDAGKAFNERLGDMLIGLGTMLVQTGIAASVLGALSFIPGLQLVTGPPGAALAGGAIATGAGITMIVAGKAMGGGGEVGAGSPSSAGGGGGGGGSSRSSAPRGFSTAFQGGGGQAVTQIINFNRPVTQPRRVARELRDAMTPGDVLTPGFAGGR